MLHKTITIKASDYQYPTIEERSAVYKTEPLISNFGFSNVSPLVAILNENKSPETMRRDDSLYWWDTCLQNRIGSLSHTYINALVHFERGIPDNMNDFNEQHYFNRIQFDFFAETYYYFFSTVKDNIAQVLNVYFTLNLKETGIHFNDEFAKKLPNAAKRIAEDFLSSTKQTVEYRNSFTHRYMPNHPDNRTIIKITRGQSTFYSATGNFVSSKEFQNNIVESQLALSTLLNGLQPMLISKI